MDSFLITLVVIAIAGLSNWLQRRAQAEQQHPTNLPPRTPPVSGPRPRPGTLAEPAPAPTFQNWERELRRLLGEETLELPPSRPPATLPPVASPVRLPAPRPAAPPPVTSVRPSARPVAQKASLTDAGQGFNRAQSLPQSVAQRLRDVDEQTDGHRPSGFAQRSGVSGAASTIDAIRRNRDAARQAFIASLIFGPPKALED